MGKVPRIAIEIRGGNIGAIYSDTPVMITIIDYDNDMIPRPSSPDKVYPGELKLTNVLAEEDHHLIKNHPWK